MRAAAMVTILFSASDIFRKVPATLRKPAALSWTLRCIVVRLLCAGIVDRREKNAQRVENRSRRLGHQAMTAPRQGYDPLVDQCFDEQRCICPRRHEVALSK